MLFFFKKYILKEYHKISLFIIIIASFFISIFKSIHNTDPLHFSYLFYDSTKLLEGLTPFKDIHIVYGILTTLIHSFSIIYHHIIQQQRFNHISMQEVLMQF